MRSSILERPARGPPTPSRAQSKSMPPKQSGSQAQLMRPKKAYQYNSISYIPRTVGAIGFPRDIPRFTTCVGSSRRSAKMFTPEQRTPASIILVRPEAVKKRRSPRCRLRSESTVSGDQVRRLRYGHPGKGYFGRVIGALMGIDIQVHALSGFHVRPASVLQKFVGDCYRLSDVPLQYQYPK